MSETGELETTRFSLVFLPALPNNSTDLMVKTLSQNLQQPIDKILYSAGSDQLQNEWQLSVKSITDEDAGAPSTADSLPENTVTRTSVTELLVTLGRNGKLFAPRATLLTVKEQQQALLLCLARRNKEIHGEFCAVASDLLDAWNALGKRTFENRPITTDTTSDPVERETSELLSTYSAFVRSSNNIDQFSLHSALSTGFTRQNPALIDAVNEKILVVEGPLSSSEWALLQPVLQYPQCIAYTATLEELVPPPQPLLGRAASFDLDLSGIEDDVPATPPLSEALSSSSNGLSAATSSVGNSGTVLTIGERQVQLYLTKLEQKLNLSQAEVESKCLGCFDDITKSSKLTWKTPLTRTLLGGGGGGATPLARKLSDSSATPVSRNKTGCLKQTPNNLSAEANVLPLPVGRDASCESLHTPKRKGSDVNPSALGAGSAASVRRSPRHSAKKSQGQACCQYVQQVMVSQLRLLLNTRDELALAINCSLPGTELSQTAFADIKKVAQEKNMPMYQTILSVIQKIRLGGRGYQPDASCPILSHVKALSAFVDHLNKLDTILEDEPDAKRAATKILVKIKRYLVQLCSGINSLGCALKPATIESVHATLVHKLETCVSRVTKNTEKKAIKPVTGQLQPALQLLQRLCDSCAGEYSTRGESVVTLVSEGDEGDTSGILLSQGYNTPSTAVTPLRIPSVLTLFRTPPVGVDPDVEQPSLRVRLMKQRTPVRPQRQHLSCLSWAPDNLSPVQVVDSPSVDDAPVLGPTLAAAAPARKRSSQHWQDVIASLPDRTEETVVETKGKALKVVGGKGKKAVEGEKKKDTEVEKDSASSSALGKKRSSKRSLLSDISNLAEEKSNEATNNKKAKKAPAVANPKAKKKDTKPQPANQRSIMNFFKSTK